MPMVCPQCNRAFGQPLDCPECGGRLLVQANARGPAPDDGAAGEGSQWNQTPWGRMAVGLILAQGLAYGLQQFLTAGLLATGEHASAWSTIGGMVLFFALNLGKSVTANACIPAVAGAAYLATWALLSQSAKQLRSFTR